VRLTDCESEISCYSWYLVDTWAALTSRNGGDGVLLVANSMLMHRLDCTHLRGCIARLATSVVAASLRCRVARIIANLRCCVALLATGIVTASLRRRVARIMAHLRCCVALLATGIVTASLRRRVARIIAHLWCCVALLATGIFTASIRSGVARHMSHLWCCSFAVCKNPMRRRIRVSVCHGCRWDIAFGALGSTDECSYDPSHTKADSGQRADRNAHNGAAAQFLLLPLFACFL
jgi:hypothetical protein